MTEPTSTGVVRSPAKNVSLREALGRHSEKIAVFGVRPEAYIEAALMAAVKVPELLKCSPESIVLALRQCAQTGLEIGRTAHLVPFKGTATFVPDYRGLIELAIGTHKVVSIRTRAVYEGEEFQYSETAHGPDIRHTPRLSGTGGAIVGAYAIADLRFNRFKVEWMTVEEIEVVRKKSKSWAAGTLPDWYARKTVVRRLCKTLPMSAKLQTALRYDDAEPDEMPDESAPRIGAPAPQGYTLSVDYSEAEIVREPVAAADLTVTEVPADHLQRTAPAAKAGAQIADPYQDAA